MPQCCSVWLTTGLTPKLSYPHPALAHFEIRLFFHLPLGPAHLDHLPTCLTSSLVLLPLLSGQEDQGRCQAGWEVVQMRWPQRQMEEQPDLKVCQGGMRIRQLWGEPCGQADAAALGLRPHQGGL